MILVDTSIWIDHLRHAEPKIASLVQMRDILCHPFVVGELSMGTLRERREVLRLLRRLPQAVIVREAEVESFVTRYSLFGVGIGYIDAHLLASVQLMPGSLLWTRDKQLSNCAERLGLAMLEAPLRPH